MANCLLDFIEMTESIPAELRGQLKRVYDLDTQVHDKLKEIELFSSDDKTLSEEERQKQYEMFLEKCDAAFALSNDKVDVADRLHDLIEKTLRLLDQNLDKLKEDLLEGDKAYIVEDIERRSQELDEQLRLEQEDLLARSLQNYRKSNDLKYPPHHNPGIAESTSSKSIHLDRQNNHHHHHRNSNSAQNSGTGNVIHQHRKRKESSDAPVGRPRKRERKRLNSSMNNFDRNSLVNEDDSIMSGMEFSDLPITPDLLASNKSSAFNDILANDPDLSLNKNMIAGSHRNFAGIHDKSNGSLQPGSKQAVLIPTDVSNNKRMQNIDSNLPFNQQHSSLSSALSSSTTTNSQMMNNSNSNQQVSPISSLQFSWNVWCSPLGNHQQVQHAANTPLISRDETKYCICRQVSYGEMVACDNDECEIEWFHYDCVGITHPPKGKWFCPDCFRKLANRSQNQQQQQQTDPSNNHQQIPQTQKKRGRKEKSVLNLVNDPIDSRSKDGRSSEQTKSVA